MAGSQCFLPVVHPVPRLAEASLTLTLTLTLTLALPRLSPGWGSSQICTPWALRAPESSLSSAQRLTKPRAGREPWKAECRPKEANVCSMSGPEAGALGMLLPPRAPTPSP